MSRTPSLILTLGLIFTLGFFAGCGGSTAPQQKVADQSDSPSKGVVQQDQTGDTSEPEITEKKQLTYGDLIEAAEKLVQKRDWTNATRVLTTAIKAKPTKSEAYLKRASILAEAKLYKQAVADMSSAIGIELTNPKYRNTRGYFLLMLKDYEAAERDFNRAIDLDPEYAQAYNNRGLVFIGQDKHIKALNDFRKASDLKDDYVDALNNLGFVYLQMEDPDREKAIETFTAVLEIDENYLNAISNRGRAYLGLEKFDEAIADFTTAIEKNPKNEQFYLHRSEAYRAAGKFELARQDVEQVTRNRQITELNRMIKNNPRRKELWLTRAQLLIRNNDLEGAKRAIDNALKIDPKFVQSLLTRAKLHESEGEFEQVIDLCSQILEIEPNTEARSLRADAYVATGKLDEAIAEFDATRRFDTKVVEAYEARAKQREENGETELAEEDRALAASMLKRLTEAPSTADESKPREMVIQQVGFEQEASAGNEDDSEETVVE